ncbi:MAG: hypothetical protein E7107_13405 [Prevotella sp.]|nr:hypothetical protein [Prevotella sp.]
MKNLVLIFALLMTLACCTSEADRERMRALLDRADSMNRAYIPMTDGMDSLLLEATRFYDRHGDADQQVRAHYLLGCAYRDMGEAPAALQSYQDAIDRADTTAADCDYKQLCRVYAQMAQIFYEQGLYREQLESSRHSAMYAWKGKDTLAALMSYEQESQAYRNLNMPDSLLYICEHVAGLYRKYGYTRYASRSLGNTLRILIPRQEYDKVRNYMQIYESESGYFDSLGNIQKGREIYYRIKGLYFLRTNVLDSAEHYFRKELRDGKDFNNKNAGALGLAALYQSLHQPDSAAKYSLYAYAMNDSVYAHRATKDIERIQAMYNYQRFQLKAEKEERAVDRARIAIIFIILGFVLLSLLFLFLLRRYRHKKQAEILRLSTDYERAVSDYETACEENELLRQSGKDIIEYKTQEIASLQKLVSQYEQQWQEVTQQDKEEALMNSDLVCAFCDMAIGKLGTIVR